MPIAGHNRIGSHNARLGSPSVAAAPHPRGFSLHGQFGHARRSETNPTTTLHELWGGLLLAAGSVLFWVPVLAFVCSTLGASAGIQFWLAIACVLFVLELCLWLWLCAG